MTLFGSWVLFPLVLGLASLGCGSLVQRASGRRLPEALIMPVGLALVIVVAEVTTKLAVTAPLTTPLVVAVAILGFALARPWAERPGVTLWPLIAAGAVYLVYLAPVLASGEPTFTGYIKLDDTATWMAMTDRVLSSGHSLAGLPPSTYEATLHFYLTGGEPVGAMLPWGIAARLVGQDLAWVFQPYLAFLGAMLALSTWSLAGTLVRARPLRAAVVFLAAQAALIYGYSLWGGIKEVAAAVLLALSAACAIPIFEAEARPRSVVPLATATFAMLGVLGYGGAVWLALPLACVAVGALRIWRRRASRVQLAALITVALIFAAALIRGAQGFVSANGALTSNQLGNLTGRLNPLQLFGIWPAGDFRVQPPGAAGLTYGLIVVLILGICLALVRAWRARSWPLPLYLGAAAVGVILVSARGSPWVQGKAFATAAPAVVLTGLAGAAALLDLPPAFAGRELRRGRPGAIRARRVLAATACGAIALGVLWSNFDAYRHVTLAPYGQLSELAGIGQRFAGSGPALLNEFEPYGVRHFLRAMDPESPSELRRRRIPLRDGSIVPTGGFADLDQFQLSALLVYRTIVIRTSPSASRPPAPYRLVYAGRWYQVWQRPARPGRSIVDSLPLGNELNPVAVPACSQVLRLAHEAGARGLLAATTRPGPYIASVPSPLPHTTRRGFTIARPAVYELWLGGSFTRRLSTLVDGRRIGSSSPVLGEAGDWTPLGEIRLGIGAHEVTLTYGDASFSPGGAGPGAAGPGLSVGPLAISAPAGNPSVAHVAPSRARSLCGRSWDWIEAIGA